MKADRSVAPVDLKPACAEAELLDRSADADAGSGCQLTGQRDFAIIRTLVLITEERRMASPKHVLIVGLQPQLIDFSAPEFAAFPGLNADKVMQGLDAGARSLIALGYDATLCLTDFGETAETVLRDELRTRKYDCVVVGAGVRTVATHFLLFEKMINIIHEHAPGARICFNTNPGDTAEAVKRWL